MKLKDVVDIKAGHPFRGRVEEDLNGNGFAIQMKDVEIVGSTGVVRWDGLVQTNVVSRKEPDWLKAGAVLFVARGSRNFALYLKEVPVPSVCSQLFFLLRPPVESLLPEFLAWQINQTPAQRYIEQSAEGSAQLGIRRAILEEMPIAVPPIQVQKQIIRLSETAYHEMKVMRQLIKNREQQLDAIARDLLNQDS